MALLGVSVLVLATWSGCGDDEAPPAGLQETGSAACADGKDNDNDGLTDCKDTDCLAYCAGKSENTAALCQDTKDNDEDGKTDCLDSDCAKDSACLETSVTACNDNKDNDEDGLTDCADFDCYSSPACCKMAPADFSGPFFSYTKSDCTNTRCVSDLTCCKQSIDYNQCCQGTLHCHGFDPSLWILWGLPRFRQLDVSPLSTARRRFIATV